MAIKVAHIITRLELGGAQLNTLYTVENLPRDKFNVTLITGRAGLLDEAAKKKTRVIFISSLRREIVPWLDIAALAKIWLICKKERFQIVHTHSSKAGILGRWAARLAGVPVIIHTIHGWSFHEGQNFFVRKLYVLLEKLTAKITAKLITVSERDVELGSKEGIGDKSQYQVIRSGIDIEKFSQIKVDVKDKKKKLGLNTDLPVVGMVACLKPQKAPLDFVKLAHLVHKEMPDVQFLLVGDGILRHKVEALKARLGLDGNFVMAGWRDDISEIMPCLDVLCLTSRWEGLPRVILEAVSAGTPVVATDVGGNPEVITDGINGYLVNAGDITGMTERIVELLNQYVRQTCKINDRLDSSFDIKKMLIEIESLYEKVIIAITDSKGFLKLSRPVEDILKEARREDEMFEVRKYLRLKDRNVS